MKLLFERFYPYIFMGLAAYFWVYLEVTFPAKDSLLSATLGVSGIFVGFLATSKAILMSMSSAIIDKLRETGYMKILASYIAEAIWLNLSFGIFNVIGFFGNQEQSWFSVLWVPLAVGALFSFVRVTHTMLQIFRHH
ncbi:MAG: hypothetical protein V7756_04565 [Halopseudomonas sp.]|uniref:hypothetical protein n=1 Tax=Halopseudomonas sp. TaxID=2901191 RepID=UPI003003A485